MSGNSLQVHIILTKYDHTKFLFYTIESEILEFFKIKNSNDIEKIKDIHFDYVKYKPTKNVPVIEDSHLCFTYGCSSDQYVYLLYSGVDRKKATSFIKGNILLVFDWKGKPIMKYNLDIDINAIAVDNNDKVLYAVTDKPEGTLVSFKLK